MLYSSSSSKTFQISLYLLYYYVPKNQVWRLRYDPLQHQIGKFKENITLYEHTLKKLILPMQPERGLKQLSLLTKKIYFIFLIATLGSVILGRKHDIFASHGSYPPPYVLEVLLEFRNTVCPRSSQPFYIVSYYTKWVTTSWT